MGEKGKNQGKRMEDEKLTSTFERRREIEQGEIAKREKLDSLKP